jgi:vesicle-fusing ATPase
MIDWTSMGARFSNAILQTLLVLFRKRPPKSRRLLVIGTTSERTVLRQMDVINAFDAEIPVPNIENMTDLNEILKSVKAFDDQERHNVLNELQTITGSKEVKVGIKNILSILETSRQDEDVGRRFVDLMANSIGENIGG